MQKSSSLLPNITIRRRADWPLATFIAGLWLITTILFCSWHIPLWLKVSTALVTILEVAQFIMSEVLLRGDKAMRLITFADKAAWYQTAYETQKIRRVLSSTYICPWLANVFIKNDKNQTINWLITPFSLQQGTLKSLRFALKNLQKPS